MNIDGIRKKPENVTIQGIKQVRITSPHISSVIVPHEKISRALERDQKKIQSRFAVVIISVLVLATVFGAGMNFVSQTPQSLAEEPSVPPGTLPFSLGNGGLGPVSSVPNDMLFNLPIEQLESYFASQHKPDEKAQELATRSEKIRIFLENKKSPFSEFSETIASQPHWKLILAIAFAESTLGKKCADNNCSNIGVKPGHAMWRKYPSLKEWVIDFNSLLERRYKDWTLEDMCGVYVKPCNPNWMLATTQILSELKENGVE